MFDKNKKYSEVGFNIYGAVFFQDGKYYNNAHKEVTLGSDESQNEQTIETDTKVRVEEESAPKPAKRKYTRKTKKAK